MPAPQEDRTRIVRDKRTTTDYLEGNNIGGGGSGSSSSRVASAVVTSIDNLELRPRCRPENQLPMKLTPQEIRLIERAIGGPMDGSSSSSNSSAAATANARGGRNVGGNNNAPTPTTAQASSSLLSLQITACPSACLMDMAGDPNILARQYAGLATWA